MPLEKRKVLDAALVRFITYNGLPFNVARCPEMKEFAALCGAPNYQFPPHLG